MTRTLLCRTSLAAASALVVGTVPALVLVGPSLAASPPHARPVIVQALPPAYLPSPAPTFPGGAPSAQSRYQAAPVPNRDVEAPSQRASTEPQLSATLYNRRDQFRGDALAPNSSAQIDMERRVRPGAGFSLKIPQ